MNDLHWSQCPFVVVDVEGNGQTPAELVELATVQVCERKIQGSRAWVIRPTAPITKYAESIHGITNQQAARFPPWSAVSHEIIPELAGRVVVGHNVGVDARLIRQAEPGWQPLALVDTLTLARKVVPGQPSYALSALIKQLLPEAETNWQRHRAEGDALVTAALFLKLATLLEQKVELKLLALFQIAAVTDDNYLQSQQGSLF